MMSMNLSDISIFNTKRFDYRCIIILISKNEAIKIMQNVDSTEKVKHYKASKICFHI